MLPETLPPPSPRDPQSNGLRGVELLAAQAENLDRTEARKSAGENMASFDGMLNKFTTSAMPDVS